MTRARKPVHYRGPYHVTARKVREAAYADPTTRCWRCRQPLPTCGPQGNGRHRNGKPARWTAGHVIDSDPSSPLLPECSPCNKSAGARLGNARRRAKQRRQTAQTATQEPMSDPW